MALPQADDATNFVADPAFVGEVVGFAFRTGETGLGYYRDTRAEPSAINLQAIEPPLVGPARPQRSAIKNKPPARRRNTDGTRRKTRSRKQKAAAPTCDPFIRPVSSIASRAWWADCG